LIVIIESLKFSDTTSLVIDTHLNRYGYYRTKAVQEFMHKGLLNLHPIEEMGEETHEEIELFTSMIRSKLGRLAIYE
jgi:hypothetical protein